MSAHLPRSVLPPTARLPKGQPPIWGMFCQAADLSFFRYVHTHAPSPPIFNGPHSSSDGSGLIFFRGGGGESLTNNYAGTSWASAAILKINLKQDGRPQISLYANSTANSRVEVLPRRSSTWYQKLLFIVAAELATPSMSKINKHFLLSFTLPLHAKLWVCKQLLYMSHSLGKMYLLHDWFVPEFRLGMKHCASGEANGSLHT